MHPADHALSSAAALGLPTDRWPEFHPLHEWMDATKAVMAHLRHRALRHHAEGIDEHVARFGPVLEGGDGLNACRAALLRAHLDEDVDLGGRVPTAADWLETFTPPGWMPRGVLPTPDECAEATSVRHGGEPSVWRTFHAWMLEDSGMVKRFGDNRHLAIRHHAWGCFDAQERWGVMLEGVPVRVLAEGHVRLVAGRIAPASEWLDRIAPQRWMSPNPATVARVKALGRTKIRG